MRTKRILALILVTVMLVAALASCGSAYKKPAEYITLPSLGNIKITKDELKEAIDEQIKESLEGSEGQVFEPVEGDAAVIQKGDQILIDYKGTPKTEVSDSTKDTLSGEDFYLTIGSNSTTFPVDYTNKNNDSITDDKDEEITTIVEGIEDQLIGKKAGETVTVTGKFANTNSKDELKNLEVSYEITIKAVARITINSDFTVGITYTVTTDKDAVADKLLPVITTEKTEEEAEPADSSSEAEEESASPASEEAADTSDTADTTGTTETTSKPFATLFPNVTTSTNFDLSSSTTTFGKIFTVADMARYFEGKHLYDEFAIQLTVPEDYKGEDYAEYRGKDIFFSIKVEKTTSVPEWTDYFVNKWTTGEYETKEAYEEYLTGELKKTLAYDAILEASTVVSFPYDEWEESYENYVEQYLCDFLAEATDATSGVTLDDFTPSEIEELVSEEDYDAIRVDATNSAKEAVKQRLCMEALFLELDITLSKKEYKAKLAEEEEEFNSNVFYYYYYYGIASFDQYVSYMGGDEYFELQYKYELLLDKLPTAVTYE